MRENLRREAHYWGLFGLLVLVLFVYPAGEEADTSQLFESALTALVPVAVMVALLQRGRWRHIGYVLGVPAVIAILQDAFGLEIVGPLVTKVFPLAFFAFATVVIISHVITSPKVDRNTLLGAMCGYLMLGYTWSVAYAVTWLMHPSAFVGMSAPPSGSELNYYSFVTLTTLGYGDILPVHPQARSLATAEAIAGVFYLALLVARLVAAYRTAQPGSAD